MLFNVLQKSNIIMKRDIKIETYGIYIYFGHGADKSRSALEDSILPIFLKMICKEMNFSNWKKFSLFQISYNLSNSAQTVQKESK